MGQNSYRNRPVPEYLNADEVQGLITAAPNPNARMLMMVQWRAGLRISEALALDRRDVRIGDDHPILIVRRGKGNRSRVVPVHPELVLELNIALGYIARADSPLITTLRKTRASRTTGSRWIDEAVAKAVAAGVLKANRKVSSHTLRHSYARHLLANGVQLNTLSQWLGHSSIEMTLIYVKLLPDPVGTLASIP